MQMSRETLKTHLALFFSNAPFGLYVVLARGSVDHLAPIVLVCLRLMGGLSVLLVWFRISFNRNLISSFLLLDPVLRRRIMLMGLMSGTGPIIFVSGLKSTTAVVGAAMDATSPAIAIVLAWIVGWLTTVSKSPSTDDAGSQVQIFFTPVVESDNASHHFPKRGSAKRGSSTAAHPTVGMGTVGCVVLSIIGNLLILRLDAPSHNAQEQREHVREAMGAALCFLSTVMYCMNLFLQRPLLMRIEPLELAGYLLLCASCTAGTIGVFNYHHFAELFRSQTPVTWGVIAYAALFQGWATAFLTAYSVQKTTPVLVAMYTSLVPAIASVLGFIVLRERLVAEQVAGVMVVIASVALSGWRHEATAAPEKREERERETLESSKHV